MGRSTGTVGCAVLWATAGAGCVVDVGDEHESISAADSAPGDWSLPRDVRLAGERQYVAYDPAPAWRGAGGCSGGILAGTREVGDFLLDQFSGIRSWGGYSCRQNTADASMTSVHGTGRALDLFVSMDHGAADNDRGDPVANWMVVNAEDVGVQYIVWDRTDWGAHRRGRKDGDYGGPNPHIDHIHMEITHEAARRNTPWFTDRDGDGVRTARDNCPNDANREQVDADGDGVGNVCDVCVRQDDPRQRDSDEDGVGDACDNCRHERNAGQVDADGDGRGNSCDNCDALENPGQLDDDGDGRGNACDTDDDGDGVLDDVDNCPLVDNPGQRDGDGDGRGNACQDDDDGDGVLDAVDICPGRADPDQLDADGDGHGDACHDADGDGIVDALDLCRAIAGDVQADLDADGLGDECDDDRDGDGARDAVDVCPEHEDPAQGDLDADGLGDLCDPDRDGDEVPDGVDLCPDAADPDQADSDGDGLGDPCDPEPEAPDAAEDVSVDLHDDDAPSPEIDTSPAPDLGGGCSASGRSPGPALPWLCSILLALRLRPGRPGGTPGR